jgi:predicted DNA-binding protein YlxM (UPF0122 family)
MGQSIVPLLLKRTAEFLEQQVAPQLATHDLKQKTTMSGYLLRFLAVSVEEKCQELNQENEAIRQALESVREALSRETQLSHNQARNELIEKLDSKLKKDAVTAPDLSEENYDLTEVLTETIKGLDALFEDLPEETMASLKQPLRSAIRLQLNHTLARIAAVPGL